MVLVAALLAGTLPACTWLDAPATPAAHAPAPAVTRTAATVSAIVLVNRCTSLGAANAKLAEKAMNQLVDGCGSFTGHDVRFTATLLPGGAIQFEPRGDAESIPICVLSHPLTHAVHLTRSCALDVELEASALALPSSTVAAPGGAGAKRAQ